MKDKNTFQEKIKVLTKLINCGYNTEKKISQLDMELILNIPNIKKEEMMVILDIQKSIKSNKVITYLGSGEDEQPAN